MGDEPICAADSIYLQLYLYPAVQDRAGWRRVVCGVPLGATRHNNQSQRPQSPDKRHLNKDKNRGGSEIINHGLEAGKLCNAMSCYKVICFFFVAGIWQYVVYSSSELHARWLSQLLSLSGSALLLLCLRGRSSFNRLTSLTYLLTVSVVDWPRRSKFRPGFEQICDKFQTFFCSQSGLRLCQF